MQASAESLLDEQTIYDLEMEGVDGRGGLAAELDGTRTAGGRAVFRQRLRHPFTRGVDIAAVQGTLRLVVGSRAEFEELLNPARVVQCERYAMSRYAPAPDVGGIQDSIGAWWVSLRHPEVLDDARLGVEQIRKLRASIARWLQWAAMHSLPAPLAAIAQRLEESTTRIAQGMTAVPRAPAPRRVLREDALLRGALAAHVHDILGQLYELEALLAMASVESARQWSYPEILADADRARLELIEFAHPLIDAPVRNTLRLGDRDVCLFVTGPNMAGKTSFMKAAGLCVYLAQLGLPVPAARMAWTPFRYLVSGMGTTDSVRDHCSRFLSEIRRVRAGLFAMRSRERCLLLFDEIFNSTNVGDSREATERVVAALARSTATLSLFSSHAGELVPELATMKSVALVHFDATVRDGVIYYDYRLRPGAFTGRMALRLLEQEGVLALLADQAE